MMVSKGESTNDANKEFDILLKKNKNELIEHQKGNSDRLQSDSTGSKNSNAYQSTAGPTQNICESSSSVSKDLWNKYDYNTEKLVNASASDDMDGDAVIKSQENTCFDSSNEILEIPCLESESDGHTTFQFNFAPKDAIQRLPTLKELVSLLLIKFR